MIQKHFSEVKNFIGFVTENVEKGNKAKILSKASFISDDPKFYHFTEQISNIFLNKADIPINNVCQFLILIHQDLSADLYVNDFPVILEIKAKRNIKKGEKVYQDCIADIRKLKFDGIEIKKTDKIICCFKVGWKFALFFNLHVDNRRLLEVEKIQLVLGSIYRRLQFQYVYNAIEAEKQFEEMLNDGWFPFIEILGDYKKLSGFYENKFNFHNNIKSFVNNFDKKRIERMASKWWKNKIYKDKQELIMAGIDAYLQNNKNGFVNCIKTLSSEAEGIIRISYFNKTKSKNISTKDLIKHTIEKGKHKAESDASLFFPFAFFKYMENVFFRGFNLKKNDIKISRHSSSHGVAKSNEYDKAHALQAILVLDQFYFYLN